MSAAFKGNLEICRYLTEKGTDVNILSANRETALHAASASGNLEVISLLRDKGFSDNLANTDGLTPSQIFIQFSHMNTLFKRAADI
jgi:ankyrin repeat protein